MKYHVAVPDLSGNEAAYVNECLATNWISSRGPFLTRFESAFAQFTQRKHAIATCNGTAALYLALLGQGLRPGEEVIIPSLTYVATANAVRYCGATPVFADSDPDTWCLSAASVERLITSKTRGIIPVHLYGHPCDMDPLLGLARSHNLWVVEDSAEAHGALYKGRPAGSLGTSAAFSFYGNKLITTGEGGMAVTDDDALADRLRLLRGQGMDPNRQYWHPIIGHNFRMTNIAAAIGLAQLERSEALIAQRRRIAARYSTCLDQVSETRLGCALTLPPELPWARSSFWLYSVLVSHSKFRDPLLSVLAQAGIETRPFFHPVHHFPMYRKARTDQGCPVACDLSRRGFNLPTFNGLGDADIDIIAGSLWRELGSLGAHGSVQRPHLRVGAEEERFQIAGVMPWDEKKLASFFETLKKDPETVRFFHPHPLTCGYARELCSRADVCRDHYYLGSYQGKVVAYSMLRGWDQGYTVPSFGVAVHPLLRNCGFGQAMLDHAIMESRAAGAPHLRLTVCEDNERGLHVYRKFGFVFSHTDQQLVGLLDLSLQCPTAEYRLNEKKLRMWLTPEAEGLGRTEGLAA
jgi:perosamine synthetase